MARNPDLYNRTRTDDFGGPQDLQNAWQILAGGATDCARALVDIAKYGRVEAARVAAAKTVLEMDGFTGSADGPRITIVPPQFDSARPLNESHVSSAVQARERLAALRKRTAIEANPDYGLVVSTDEVIDAVIVED